MRNRVLVIYFLLIIFCFLFACENPMVKSILPDKGSEITDGNEIILPENNDDNKTIDFIPSEPEPCNCEIDGTCECEFCNCECVPCNYDALKQDQAVLVITGGDIAKTYGDEPFTLSTTGGSGTGTVHYAIMSGSDVISISDNTVTILKAGTATVTATKAADDVFNPIASAAITITVNKADPVVSWPSGLEAYVRQTLSNITLPENIGGTEGVFSWVEAVTTSVGAAGDRTHELRFTPTDTVNYNIKEQAITVTVKTYLTSSKGIEMSWIPAGSFMAGTEGDGSVTPGSPVTLTQGFFMGKYEVTQEQWAVVMTGSENTSTPSWFSSSPATGEVQAKRPVEQVTWFDAIEFCNILSDKEGLNRYYNLTVTTRNAGGWITAGTVTINPGANGYRLPTEAQWEYAARAGSAIEYTATLDNAWYLANSNSMTRQVGLKEPNAWGLYDMLGNVWEWCWDLWGSTYPSSAADPAGAPSGSRRVGRGCSWNNTAPGARSAYRNHYDPDYRNFNFGFRVVRPDSN